MGKCTKCGAKILYNKFKVYRGKVYCYKCYADRNKKQKKEESEQYDLASGVEDCLAPAVFDGPPALQ
jgi:uncharacterized Zn finger protein (UPF0148 family)